MTQQSGRKDTSIVRDEQIARGEVTPELGKDRVLEAHAAAEDEKPRSTAILRRMLGDQRLGQLEIKLGDIHSAPALLTSPDLSVAIPLQFSRECSTSSLSGAARPD